MNLVILQRQVIHDLLNYYTARFDWSIPIIDCISVIDGTADSKLKISSAEELLNFCNKAKNVLKEMEEITSGGNTLIDQFIVFGKHLKEN